MKTLERKYQTYRRILMIGGLSMLFQVFAPTASFALTGGPLQPEFTSFEPVATTNMVNEFTGDLAWTLPVINVPGPNGGGYPLALSYHSGTSSEQEASWVGYGWSLNPGAINRNKRGFPDDRNGKSVTYHNKVPKNWTVTLGGSTKELEGFSIGDDDKLPPLMVNASLSYNNYKGFGRYVGVSAWPRGTVSLNFGLSNGQGSFSVDINPAKVLNKQKIEGDGVTDKLPTYEGATNIGQEATFSDYNNKKKTLQKSNARTNRQFSTLSSSYAMQVYGTKSYPISVSKYSGNSYHMKIAGMITPSALPYGIGSTMFGSYSYQKNEEQESAFTYGYLYTDQATSEEAMMDFYEEKSAPFQKRDKYLSLPFSNSDIFSVTGEQIAGGFKIHRKKAPSFRPKKVTSNMKSYNVGAEFEGGLDWGGGADLGVGWQQLEVDEWASDYNHSTSGDEPYFFRFNNDPGGTVEFNDNKQLALPTGNGNLWTADVITSGNVTTELSNLDRPGRSSYIDWNTNEEMIEQENNKYFRANEKDETKVNDFVDRDGTDINDGIGEFAITNETGSTYTFGLPVYSRNELNMRYGMKGVTAENIDNNFLAYRDVSDLEDLETVIGEEDKASYATTFLMTSITDKDFIDRTMDGVSDDDFGGWTKFSYSKAYGTHNKSDNTNHADSAWYKWRIPYQGLLYNRGELSTNKDDIASATAGEKEIYYLDKIETKTHVAYFITNETDVTINGKILRGSALNRKDSKAAADHEIASNSNSATSSDGLRKLEEIRLFAKDGNGDPDKLIKSVHFEYDYTLCKGLPNSDEGKLTLKKVWFEYDGIKNARITPYRFEYEYPNTTYPDPYGNLDNFGSGLNENPNYSPYEIDPWGNYQDGATAEDRYDSLRNWVNQAPPTSTFDPAAWHLKVIKLPSGGEIHVQYEQDDYYYVQDKLAHSMVSLSSESYNVPGFTNRYYLNTEDLGITFSSGQGKSNPDLLRLKQLLESQYVKGGKKMYFKFLYKLFGYNGSPQLDECNSEYIKGYVDVREVGIDANKGIYLLLGRNNEHGLPRKVCRKYYQANRQGNLNMSGTCNPQVDGVTGDNAGEIIQSFITFLAHSVIPGDVDICINMNHDLSYLRVPVPFKKLGGGIRVKRLMMYDEGMETGDKALYGTEYVYETTDRYGETISSGVAINEPSSIREENALIEFDERHKQTFIDKIIAGKDRKLTEMPLGETILPGPSVGYSKVLTKNIHTGKTNPGFTVSEYLTAKDHPFKFDNTDIKREKSKRFIPGGYFNYFRNNHWLTQGFTFYRNNMHGQTSAMTTYSGNPNDNDTWKMTAQQKYNYYPLGSRVPVVGDNNCVHLSYLGKETEVVMESKAVDDEAYDVSYEFDGSAGLAGFIPLPFFTAMGSFTKTQTKLSTHVTTKIIDYPTILRSVTSYSDGIYHTSENIAFNGYNGQPFITRITDGYDGLDVENEVDHEGAYHQYSFMAANQYKEMRQKAYYDGLTVTSQGDVDNVVKIEKADISDTDAQLNFTSMQVGGSVCREIRKFTPGDLVKVFTTTGTDWGVFHVSDTNVVQPDDSTGYLVLKKTASFASSADDLENGEVFVEIVHSGKKNNLSASVGSTITYGDTKTYESLYGWLQALGRESYSDPGLEGPCPGPTCAASIIPQYVVSSSASAYIDDWVYDTTIYGDYAAGSNQYETGYQGKWRPAASYVYREDIKGATDGLERVWKSAGVENTGVWAAGVFDWTAPFWNESQGWIKLDTTTQYSPNGNALESQDVLGIYSAAKFGYNHSIPYLVAQNSDYASAQFESFENVYAGDKLEDGLSVTTSDIKTVSHSGSQSLILGNSIYNVGLNKWDGGFSLKTMDVTDQFKNAGLQIKVWVKDTTEVESSTAGDLKLQLRNVTQSTYPDIVNCKKVARVGEWILLEASVVLDGSYNLGDEIIPSVHSTTFNKSVWIDDVRVQPADAQMVTYVYDPITLRLLSSFDDQHFGLYYVYNAEGKLVRKIIETERGRKTVTETQYNTPLISRTE